MSKAKAVDYATLRKRLEKARLKGTASATADRARNLLLVYLDHAQAQNIPVQELARQIQQGLPALRISGADLAAVAEKPDGPFGDIACASGCAFCCILAGEDGGVITEAEARNVHAALSQLPEGPDGRAWHPRACPSLDPETRMCRIYDARPMICRSYISKDATACEAISTGIPADGAGVVGAQSIYLAVHALGRAALKGIATVPTFSLSAVAAAALDGVDETAALQSAKHKPRTLDDESARLS
jgi:hypothetical protein